MKQLIIISLSAILTGCFATKPIEVDNICNLLDEKVRWYQAVKASEAKYSAPAWLQLAIIYQESHFASAATPPRDYIFGVIPWFRISSAYGFAQAKDETWRWYQTKTGRSDSSRDNFADATDFVGWYIHQSNRLAGIPKTDAYNQYLAYHEGHNGFKQKTYLQKAWLMKLAKKVSANGKRYKNQLAACQTQLDKNRVWRFF